MTGACHDAKEDRSEIQTGKAGLDCTVCERDLQARKEKAEKEAISFQAMLIPGHWTGSVTRRP